MLFYMRWEKKALPESIPKDRVHMSHWSVRSSLNYRIVEEKRNKTKSVTQATVLYPLSWHVRVNSSYTTKSFKQENLQNDLFFTEKILRLWLLRQRLWRTVPLVTQEPRPRGLFIYPHIPPSSETAIKI